MASISNASALAIEKLNNIVYSCLNNPWPNVISDKWKHNTTQDWKFLAKNFDGISNELIADGDLSKLDIHILALGYLEKGRSRFIEVTEDDNKELDKDAKKEPMVSDWEEEDIKKRTRQKEKRDAQAALLAVLCPPGHLFCAWVVVSVYIRCAWVFCSICVCCACAWVVCSVCVCCAWFVQSVYVCSACAWFVYSVCLCCACA